MNYLKRDGAMILSFGKARRAGQRGETTSPRTHGIQSIPYPLFLFVTTIQLNFNYTTHKYFFFV